MARSILLGASLAYQVAAQGPFQAITITATAVINNVLNAAALNAAATTDAGYSACVTAQAAAESCSSAIGDWDNAPYSEIAQCLCCSGTTWSPDLFDDNAETCASWIRTELPKSTSAYSAYSTLADFCESEGNVCASGSITATATRTGSAVSGTITSVASGCYSLLDIMSECAESDSDIVTATPKSQASCLCYSSNSQTTTWIPDYFDGFASECADWASTADTSDYSAYSKLATFCRSVGNILTTSSRSTGSTTTTSTSTSTPTAAQTRQSSGGTTTGPTAVTVTTTPSPTSTNAAGITYGQEPTAFGLAGIVMALFSFFL
ncbi:hypothetical protein SCAR479_12051 [Seiridium cardinale]|uniref:Uncharacterized protein n=1 Tax=Seiridium cardinale TaxID=138064 RepID=A0ABR2XBX8_9PEZI